MAFLAPVFSAVSTFLPIISTGLSVIGAIQEGRQAQQVAQYNAAVAQRQAQEARQRTAINVQSARVETAAKRREALRRLGTAQAQFGAAGLTLAGTPTDVLANMAGELELDARLTAFQGDIARFEGATQTQRFQSEGELSLLEGRQARQKSLLTAGGTLVKAASPGGSIYGAF